jgi:hypothetical protein
MTFDGPDTYASSVSLTTEQVRELAWRVAGATMAGLGVAHEDLPRLGKLVEPVIEDLIREYLVVIAEQECRPVSLPVVTGAK